jgi:hypothetical protein
MLLLLLPVFSSFLAGDIKLKQSASSIEHVTACRSFLPLTASLTALQDSIYKLPLDTSESDGFFFDSHEDSANSVLFDLHDGL